MNLQRRSLLAASLAAPALAQAQSEWRPTRPMSFILPFAAGSGTDAVARVLAQMLGAELGTTITVDNRAGANGTIAAAAAMRAAPDGHTLFVTTNTTHGANSWLLKRLVLIDCLTLAMLYTIRIITGASVVGHQLSFWLLAFSVFLFLSLAFVKRYAELALPQRAGTGKGTDKIHGRGYEAGDAPLIQTMGIASGYAAVVVLALYLNSEAVALLYRAPQVVWGAVPVMLFWISWMWMQAHRGRMDDDPLVFAVKDGASLLTALAFAGVLLVGSVGLPW